MVVTVAAAGGAGGAAGGQAQLVPARLYGFLRFRLRLCENGAHIRHALAEGERDGLAVMGEAEDAVRGEL